MDVLRDACVVFSYCCVFVFELHCVVFVLNVVVVCGCVCTCVVCLFDVMLVCDVVCVVFGADRVFGVLMCVYMLV